MKFDFNNSQYAKFWNSKEAREAFTIFVNDPTIIKQLPSFWKGQFSVDPMVTARNYDGTATFSAKMRDQKLQNMLDWRAPLGDTETRDKTGIQMYTGTIPDFAAKGYVEQAMEREARERMFEDYFGDDTQILLAYAKDLQEMILEGDSTMSNMAAQALSTGQVVYNYGRGITGPIYQAPIPSDNFTHAINHAWTDTTNCKLLDEMEQIEQDFRDRTAFVGKMKWQFTRAAFHSVVLANAQVIAYITNYRTVNEKPTVAGWNMNEQMFNEAFADNPKISPIEIVEEKQFNEGTPVNGWASGIAVLRPVGFAGQVKHTSLLDKTMFEKYGSSVINKVFARRGIYTFVNTTLNNGDFKEWHTDMFASGVPVLEEFLNHVIVNYTSTV